MPRGKRLQKVHGCDLDVLIARELSCCCGGLFFPSNFFFHRNQQAASAPADGPPGEPGRDDEIQQLRKQLLDQAAAAAAQQALMVKMAAQLALLQAATATPPPPAVLPPLAFDDLSSDEDDNVEEAAAVVATATPTPPAAAAAAAAAAATVTATPPAAAAAATPAPVTAAAAAVIVGTAAATPAAAAVPLVPVVHVLPLAPGGNGPPAAQAVAAVPVTVGGQHFAHQGPAAAPAAALPGPAAAAAQRRTTFWLKTKLAEARERPFKISLVTWDYIKIVLVAYFGVQSFEDIRVALFYELPQQRQAGILHVVFETVCLALCSDLPKSHFFVQQVRLHAGFDPDIVEALTARYMDGQFRGRHRRSDAAAVLQEQKRNHADYRNKVRVFFFFFNFIVFHPLIRFQIMQLLIKRVVKELIAAHADVLPSSPAFAELFSTAVRPHLLSASDIPDGTMVFIRRRTTDTHSLHL
jgi:hypothetical protein